MKKILSILLLTVFTFTLAGLSGCGGKTEIEKYYRKLQRADSATVEIEVEVPIFGKTQIIIKMDGNKTYTNGSTLLSQPEEYTQTVGNTRYVYNKNLQDEWVKTATDATEENFASAEYYQKFFNVEDYVYNEETDKYVGKENIRYEIMDEMEVTELIMRFNGDNCNASGKIDRNGFMLPFILVVKNLKKTSITLPI